MSLVTVGAELLSAKEKLQSFENNVTVFGSARIESSDPLYVKAYELGKELSNAGYNVFTGCLLYTSPSPRDVEESRMPSSA